MKKTAAILVTLLIIALVFSACRTYELCPAYQSKAPVKVEKKV